mmetsp:Transcript_43432/g.97777  ORF Transcript_43432/g.97777 Transcript_43432/m.97777 type:complete len:87 (-) Transcript_43432:985-1245(-)
MEHYFNSLFTTGDDVADLFQCFSRHGPSVSGSACNDLQFTVNISLRSSLFRKASNLDTKGFPNLWQANCLNRYCHYIVSGQLTVIP